MNPELYLEGVDFIFQSRKGDIKSIFRLVFIRGERGGVLWVEGGEQAGTGWLK